MITKQKTVLQSDINIGNERHHRHDRNHRLSQKLVEKIIAKIKSIKKKT